MSLRLTPADWLEKLPGPDGARSVLAFEHGTLTVKLYAPRGTAFAPGDFLFAPAGLPHRFEDFTDDLAVWVLFYGPEGGEKP